MPKIVLYGHSMCPMLPPIWSMLKLSKVDFDYINIHQDAVGRERVQQINHGNESVPPMVFPDGSTLTEPSVGQLKAKLEKFGYGVPITAQLMGNVLMITVIIGILFALLRIMGIF